MSLPQTKKVLRSKGNRRQNEKTPYQMRRYSPVTHLIHPKFIKNSDN